MDIEVLAFEKLAEIRAIEILEELQKEASTLGGAALGAATGATAGALSTKDKEKRLRRALIGGALGTAGGAATGHALGSLRQVKKLRQDIRGRGKDLYARAKEVLETEGKTKKAELEKQARSKNIIQQMERVMENPRASETAKKYVQGVLSARDVSKGARRLPARVGRYHKDQARAVIKQSSDEIEQLAMAELEKQAKLPSHLRRMIGKSTEEVPGRLSNVLNKAEVSKALKGAHKRDYDLGGRIMASRWGQHAARTGSKESISAGKLQRSLTR